MKRTWSYLALVVVACACSLFGYRMGKSDLTVHEVSYLTPHYLETTDSGDISTEIDGDDSQSLIVETGVDQIDSSERKQSPHDVNEMQVIRRAELLGISAETLDKPELAWKSIYASVHANVDPPLGRRGRDA